MDYKEKYEMALETVQEILSSGSDSIKMSRLKLRLQPVFTELAESEDEKIRKELINILNLSYNCGIAITKENRDKYIAWLEKQGKQKPQGKSALEAINEVKVDNSNSANCIEHHDPNNIWTLNDAIPGNVIVDGDGFICIYQEPSTKTFFHSFCYCIKDKFCPLKGSHKIKNCRLATKQECDKLFSEMYKAGYEWDDDKLELKKSQRMIAAEAKEALYSKPVECGETCGDNRFEIIEKAKQDLLNRTNIETSSDEMKVLDGFLFRCWQMGWLKDYDNITL